MKVLLTGAAGFVGRHVLAALRAQAIDVHATDLRAGPGWDALDVTDRDAVRRTMAAVQPDTLLHAAAITPGDDADPGMVAAVNAHGTFTVFDAARPFVRHAVLVSSAAVLGPARSDDPVAEDAPAAPATLYAASKLAAETMAARTGVKLAIIRLAAVYGPDERPSPSRPRTSLVHRLRTASRVGGPDVTLDLIHAEDAAHAIAALLLRPDATGLFHLGGGEAVRWTRLLQAFQGRAGGNGPALIVSAADARPVLATGRIAAAIGLRPRSIEDGMRALLA